MAAIGGRAADAEEAPTLISDLFRAINDRIRELKDAPTGECAFICECEDEACMHVLRMTIPEYDAAREDPAQHAVLPGHQRPAVQDVVLRRDRFVVVKNVLRQGGGQ